MPISERRKAMWNNLRKSLIFLLFMLTSFLAVCIVLLLPNAMAMASSDTEEEPARDIVLKNDRICTGCHDEDSDYPVLAIGKTRHGTITDGRTPTCVSCHGDGNGHKDKPEKVFSSPLSFGKNSTNPIEERNRTCLTCHEGGKRMHWAGSVHANRDTACTACHQIHTGRDKVRDRTTQAEICFSCHKEQRAQINRPSRHPVREGKVICSDCHNPHGSAGPSKMVRDSINETCFTCHMEKRGPFIRNHPPVQENCAICHNPHGTTAPNLLRSRSPFLCQECHEPNTHQGNSGTLTGAYARNTLARGCLNCHTEIHGSNNPENVRNERLFQR